MGADTYIGQVVGARHAVIVQRAGEQLARVVVDAALQQRLPNALGDPALHLALDDHRVDDAPDVIDGGKVDDLCNAGLGVNLYLADMTTAGEGEVQRVVEGLLVEPRLQGLERVIVGHVGGERHVAEGH